MADLALSAVQTLFAALQCQQLQDFCDMLGYKSHLKDLEKTVSTVKKVLIGAEIRDGELSPEEEDYIDKLKDAVYDADDLFDEVLALSELKKYKTGGKLTNKVRLFFFSVNPLSVAHNVSTQIKVIRKNLEDISNNHHKFGLKFDSRPIRKNMPKETHSSVNEFEVIGRKGETKAVVDRLLESNEEVSFLSIVGVGGLGKTTLAQLVYNDERIKREFSDSRFWVCVSDHDKERFDVRVILSNIIELVTGEKPRDDSSMETVQCKFQRALGGKKCLIVLDDIWNEDHCKWLDLRGFLMRLGGESRILATTRSVETSTIIGNGDTSTYKLGGLSPKNSWRLFSLMAFGNKQELDIPTDYVDIGRKIVEKCCCVPLVLKVVGSLLFGQDKSKWDAFEHREVTRIKKGDNDIMSILKFSYLNLESPLKSCFKYCAIFPKDYRLKKKMLISLWEAQGYIVPFEEGQSIQDAGEEYFSILLKRCFFQEVEEDDFGEVRSCKIHDFMHDLAEEVAGNEIWRSNYTRGAVGEKVRHLGHYRNGDTKKFSFSSKIRSCLMYDTFEGVSLLADNWKCLRVLKLNDSNIETLPETIGTCLHLRSLDLSCCYHLLALPNSIAKLQSLQTLDISYCYCLNELPKNLSKLEKLKHLFFEGCRSFTHMPSRFDKLKCLTSLTMFIVNEGNDSSENRHGELNDLQILTELRGSISILVRRYTNNGKKKEEGGYLKRLKHLKAVDISFEGNNVMKSDEEALMEKLELQSNLRSLSIKCYNGSIIPKWGRQLDDWATIMPGVVEIVFSECKEMKELPLLSRLRYLKNLIISELPNLEYMEDFTTADATSKESGFFPSLCHLELRGLHNLKGWWSNEKGQFCFPRLSELIINGCPNFASSLCCPSLKSLDLRRCNQGLSISVGNDDNINPRHDIKLKDVCVDTLDYLGSMHMENLRLTTIEFANGKGIVITSKAEELLKSWSSSLRNLWFTSCMELASIPGVLEHLSSLETLSVYNAPELRFDEAAQPWRSLSHTLRTLTLNRIPKAVSLPKGLQYLTNLQLLRIEDCDNLESIPEWIGSLSSLRELVITDCQKIKSLPSEVSKLTSLFELYIWGCSEELYQRCQRDPQGDDWLNICHVPHLDIRMLRQSSVLPRENSVGKVSVGTVSVGTVSLGTVSLGSKVKSKKKKKTMRMSKEEMIYFSPKGSSEVVAAPGPAPEPMPMPMPKGVSDQAGAEIYEMESLMNVVRLFCTLFEDYELDKDKLVQLWIASGFIRDEHKYCIADSVFESLLSNNDIEHSSTCFPSGKNMYKVNVKRLMYGVQNMENLRLKEIRHDEPYELVRRLALVGDAIDEDTLKALRKFKDLKALLLLCDSVLNIYTIPDGLFSALKHLEVLDLSKTRLKEMPSSVENLVDLRYLDLSHTLIELLPETIDCLVKLQTLRLKDCRHLLRLPEGMRKLSSLEHLEFDVLNQLPFMPTRIGSLAQLKTLSAFIIHKDDGRSIKELKNMNHLEGRFCISGLENISSYFEIHEADLSKKNLKELELRWHKSHFNRKVGEYELILELLCPSFHLEKLQISCYNGHNFPRWISDPSFNKLTSITLFKCEVFPVIPSFGTLPSLVCLNLFDLASVRTLRRNSYDQPKASVAFPKLEKLKIVGLSKLAKWDEAEDTDYPNLRELIVERCPKLVKLPSSILKLCTLKHLEVINCSRLTTFLDTNLSTSLTTLIIEDCPEVIMWIQSFEDEECWRKNIKHVKDVYIDLDEN